MKKVLLISMPWSCYSRPSIQLGVLTSYLMNNGIEVENKYFNLKLANKLGVEDYQALAGTQLEASFLDSEILYPNKEFSFYDIIEEKTLFKNKNIDPKDIINKIRQSQEEMIGEIELEKYDIIGFTIGYQQLLSSVSLAMAIKQKAPEKVIVFGGASCYEKMGESICQIYSCVDIVATGEGEETLLEIVNTLRSGQSLKDVLGICYRENGEVKVNLPRPLCKDLDKYPYPNFDAYFEQYAKYPNFGTYSYYNTSKLVIEGSRGCWWNKCAFCGLNRQFVDNQRVFRPKTIQRIVNEMEYQKQRYKMSNICFTDNTQYKIRQLTEEISKLQSDYTLFIECRTDVSPRDLYNMKQAGFESIQIGVESFSKNLLKKMNKGVTVMQNINTLKWCKFLDIKPFYNIITQFPSERIEDVEEIISISKKIAHFDPPTGLSQFSLDYQSIVYQNYESYNIRNIRPKELYKYIYDKEALEKLIFNSYDYDHIIPLETRQKWDEFISVYNLWKEQGSDKRLLYIDGGSFVKILDNRQGELTTGILDKREGEIFLYCDFIRTKDEILEKFSQYERNFVEEVLQMFVEYGVIYEEDGSYLSLAIPRTARSRNRIISKLSI